MPVDEDEMKSIVDQKREIEALREELAASEAKVANLVHAIELLNRQLADARAWIAEYGKGD
jgi:cell division protein FtsB